MFAETLGDPPIRCCAQGDHGIRNVPAVEPPRTDVFRVFRIGRVAGKLRVETPVTIDAPIDAAAIVDRVPACPGLELS